jgi:PAS domain S-box-containing protein
MILKETQVRPIQSISINTPKPLAQKYLKEYRETFLFITKEDQLVGYLRSKDLFNDLTSLHDYLPIHLQYETDSDISELDLLKILGEEIVVVKNKVNGTSGYLTREDILYEILRKEDKDLGIFRTILTSIPMGIFVVDRQGRIVNWNDEGLRMIRVNADKIRKSHASDIFDPLIIQRVCTTRERVLNQIHIKNEIGILADYSPFFNKQGEVEGIVIVVQDLPMVEEMAMELDYVKGLNKDLQAILSTIYDEILVVNNKGELIRYSDHHMLDIWETDLRELVGKNLVELEEKGLVQPSVIRLVFERKRKVSVMQETKNGKKLMAVGNPIFDENGELDRIVIASRDITETTELKHELLEMKKISEQYKKELESLKNREKISKMILYASPKMHQIMKEVEKVSKFSSTVLILGESGVGKEVIAKAIHQLGPRAGQPFLKLNCGAIPEHLLESELFGYEKGAFTGADPKGKKGYFQQADKGILFLDEVSELPLGLQVKLLRALQEREITPIGSTVAIPIDVQIIAASNKNLEQMVENGTFREDLFYRLNVIPIHIPPLRERPEDVPILTYHILNQLNTRHGRNVQLSPDALNLLETYTWPGNVRELQNLIERLVITADEDTVDSNQVSKLLRWDKSVSKSKPVITNLMPLQEALESVEEQLIQLAMERYKTTTMAAKVLGISQSTVSRKYQKILKHRE